MGESWRHHTTHLSILEGAWPPKQAKLINWPKGTSVQGTTDSIGWAVVLIASIEAEQSGGGRGEQECPEKTPCTSSEI